MDAQNRIIRIVVADTQFLVTESLKTILNSDKYELAEVLNSCYELEKCLGKTSFELLITDFAMLDYDGFNELKQIKKSYPEMAIVVLTNLITRNEFIELTNIGIRNIIYKTADKEELLNAIEASLKSKKYFTGEILELMLEQAEKKNVIEEHPQLTNAEKEIIRLIAKGLTTKEIADCKNISFHTVMTHRKNIFRKLSINSASELLIYAMKAGMFDSIEYHI